ncbi:hypothetical protein ACFE04_019766 [Oxalis oulophora]
MASKLFYRKSQFVIDKEKEVKDIESKMDGMSMVDEFAKYAKLQRKANALKEQLKTENSKGEEPADKMKKFAIIFGIRWLWDVICSYIIWNNMNTPILHLNPSWLMPLNAVIAWPSGTPGDVGKVSSIDDGPEVPKKFQWHFGEPSEKYCHFPKSW